MKTDNAKEMTNWKKMMKWRLYTTLGGNYFSDASNHHISLINVQSNW